ncbi:MAG: type II toxin-antitoxin system mRNA interferase toxin, RelE/StbE family [Richelia sp. RM2_1_2]|nr:type II toxin-antitoxin system mRNA interferase toxin, RelE/StbE family [Richelia sp. SM2_1_7]NJM20671.1 type II toxin-antitoxin system mRNA interferase toxin, RelE/StbE family [Richelia sp. SM1_7_0]NJN09153.1 type II toxin-antitoxin system mRNA interferase toxin, RelE/StbE family [Richelia sp. RM1_1_1]NJO28695.1 type II toxin-antitoxin system mRNA interferase toxin, RelE/StbE family [Richelia sp. SL_2_1]NJO60714.1 type II toxin-antitoxin system mRNA interferase toxin, RelE/StbE family [Rich
MIRLVLTPKFKRAFGKFVKRNANLQERIENTLLLMEADIFAANLGTHKLSGKLDGLQSCSCGYDCRIVFSMEQDEDTNTEVIVLLDIGTHDEVY